MVTMLEGGVSSSFTLTAGIQSPEAVLVRLADTLYVASSVPQQSADEAYEKTRMDTVNLPTPPIAKSTSVQMQPAGMQSIEISDVQDGPALFPDPLKSSTETMQKKALVAHPTTGVPTTPMLPTTTHHVEQPPSLRRLPTLNAHPGKLPFEPAVETKPKPSAAGSIVMGNEPVSSQDRPPVSTHNLANQFDTPELDQQANTAATSLAVGEGSERHFDSTEVGWLAEQSRAEASSSRLAAVFATWDKNNDGHLTGFELVSALRSLNQVLDFDSIVRNKPLDDRTVRTLLAFIFLLDKNGYEPGT